MQWRRPTAEKTLTFVTNASWFYMLHVTNIPILLGTCNKDCPFLHIDPMSKRKECPWYDRGFCKHGKHFNNLNISMNEKSVGTTELHYSTKKQYHILTILNG